MTSLTSTLVAACAWIIWYNMAWRKYMNWPSGWDIWNDDRIAVSSPLCIHEWWASTLRFLYKSFSGIVRRTTWIMDWNDDPPTMIKDFESKKWITSTAATRSRIAVTIGVFYCSSSLCVCFLLLLFFSFYYHFVFPLNLTVMICRHGCCMRINLFALIEFELTERGRIVHTYTQTVNTMSEDASHANRTLCRIIEF